MSLISQEKINDWFLKFLFAIVIGIMVYAQVEKFLEPPETVEEFWVENYEIVDQPKGIELYFNREIDESDELKMRLDIFFDESIHRYDTIVPIGNTDQQILFIKANKGTTLQELIELHLTHEDTIKSITCSLEKFRLSYPMHINQGGGFYFYRNYIPFFINYQPEHQEDRVYSRSYYDTGTDWIPCLFRNSYGKFDEEMRKQGYWEWRYSNGVTMAKAEFKDDCVSDVLTIYSYHGKLMDSVVFDQEGKVIKRTRFDLQGHVIN